jgi:hypothetical protein
MSQKNISNFTYNSILYIVTIGFISFLLVASMAPSKNSVLQNIFPKPHSKAEDVLKSPKVELFLNYKGTRKTGVINLEKNDENPVYLSWETSGDPKYCYGWSSGKNFEDGSWEGEKDVNGGNFNLNKFTQTNAFVYSIECRNEYGDAEGDSVTINVGNQTQLLSPYFSSFEVYTANHQLFDITKPVEVTFNQDLNFQWDLLNTKTPFSVCVSTGSWPTRYRNTSAASLSQKQNITEKKIYRFTLYCSNEKDSVKKSVTIIGT